MTYQKNDILTIEITDIGTEGEGIGKHEGYTLFVKDTVVGDVAEVKIMKAKKNYAYAHLERIIKPSTDRTTPRCPYAKSCGGCQIQMLDYDAQLRFKQNKVRDDLIRIGGFDADYIDSITEPIIGMEDSFRYRNKAQFPFGYDKNGEIVTGFYAGRTHSIIPNTECLLGVTENREILEVILAWMKENHVTAYDENTLRGLIRHVLIRKGFATGEIMVCLVINPDKKAKNSEYLPGQDALISELVHIEGVKSISVSINDKNTNVIMGTEVHTIWGEDRIIDKLGEIAFSISPLSFYQVNPVQTKKLYDTALEYAGLTGKESVWDLYCGIGTISLCMATKAGKVYGVEIIPEAIEDARENARINGITNAEFMVGKAEEVLPEFYDNASSDSDMLHPDVIVVDPPRKGCDAACLETMIKMAPSRIVYVSCDPATLSRDMKILYEAGYKPMRIRPVDQFCHTVHVETVALLSLETYSKSNM